MWLQRDVGVPGDENHPVARHTWAGTCCTSGERIARRSQHVLSAAVFIDVDRAEALQHRLCPSPGDIPHRENVTVVRTDWHVHNADLGQFSRSAASIDFAIAGAANIFCMP